MIERRAPGGSARSVEKPAQHICATFVNSIPRHLAYTSVCAFADLARRSHTMKLGCQRTPAGGGRYSLRSSPHAFLLLLVTTAVATAEPLAAAGAAAAAHPAPLPFDYEGTCPACCGLWLPAATCRRVQPCNGLHTGTGTITASICPLPGTVWVRRVIGGVCCVSNCVCK